ncbi:hypothetical protein [Isoptericola dokdonensis]|uniref:FtsK/SpoIIIE family protein n=1 Tax=Isoptericola dokdonensis DS-3 TaxID=1300344 RepID=A0A161HYF7_9MICO|nr:hypothetical protein [Isoptericola dokdonensis]ANC31453.1 FtsK/SpoIIIE family protein [Isoptericola dokdonensis DS-3]
MSTDTSHRPAYGEVTDVVLAPTIHSYPDRTVTDPPDPLDGRKPIGSRPAERTKARPERDGDRRPIVPTWLRDRATLGATLAWAAGYAGHFSAYHLLRAPIYAGRLAVRSPIGLGRLVAATWAWVWDTASRDIHWHVMGKVDDPNHYIKVRAERRHVIKQRAITLAFIAGPLAAAIAWVAVAAPTAAQVATAAVALLVLGALGRKANTRVTSDANEKIEVPPLTGYLITESLASLGLASITAALKGDPHAIRYVAIVRDGPGFRADIDLPGGTTAAEVIERRSKLASGLRRPLGCVWPEPDPEVHEGRLVLYVADKSMADAKTPTWDLAKAGRVNVFKPAPIGLDQRGRTVETTLMFAAGLVGAVPRMGKTFSLRLLELAAALDPRVELHIYDLKGGADHAPLAAVAHAYRTGDDPEDMAYLVADLRAARTDMRRRYKTVRGLPKDICPESKVTDEIASDRSLGLHPVMFAFDETQVMFEHPEHGKEIEEIVTDLVKRGPAVGIMTWLATQRPDAKSIPTAISANAILRFCLKVLGQVENDMVLGTSMYKAGVRATMFGRKDLGVGYLVGEGDDPVIVRTAYVDGPAAEAIAARARAARERAGLLTGLAAGVEPEDIDDSTVIDHILGIWPATDDDKLRGTVIAERLAAARPTLYDGWSAAQVHAAVKPHGVRTIQVNRTVDGQQVNGKGLARQTLVDATDR